MRAGVILALCGACGDVVGTTTDAAMEPDARSPCNQAAEFGPPVALAGVNTPAVDLVSDVSADHLTIYIASNRAGAAVQLFYATRATRSDSFGVPVPLYAPAPAYDDFSIAVSSDGLTGIVASIRNATDEDLFVVTRPSVLASFDTGTPVLGLNTATTDATPKLSRDDATLYFDSERNGSRDLYRVAAIGAGFGTPTPISEINSSALDAGPVISADELTIYFLSQRPPSSDGDIYMAVRPSRSAAFGAPVRVPSLNSPAFDGPGALSIDGCTIYLSSERNGNFDIFVARKPA